MAAADQPLTSYSDTTPHKKVITDYIDILSPSDIPMVKYFGLSGDPGKFQMVNWPGTIAYWLESTLPAMTDTVGTSIASNGTSIQVTDGSLHHVGDVLLQGSEQMWVSAVSTNTLTITRAYSGTATSIAASATLTRVSNARLEGADASFDRGVSDIVTEVNYTQIFQDDLQISATSQLVQQYGISDYFDMEAQAKMKDLLILMEKSFFTGQAKAGSATTPRAFGGLDTYIADNTAAVSAALTEKDIHDLLNSIYADGGQANLLVCNSWVKRKINAMYEGFIRTTRAEHAGGALISQLDTDFGTVEVLMDRWCATNKLYALDTSRIGFMEFRPFMQEPLAKTGDSIKGQIVGEYTLVVQSDKAHGYLTSISTST